MPMIGTLPFGHGMARRIDPCQHFDLYCLIAEHAYTACGMRWQKPAAPGRNGRPPNSIRFPGPLPVSLYRNDIRQLFFSGDESILTWKSDGERMLVIITTIGMQTLSVCFDRARNMYIVSLNLDMLFGGVSADDIVTMTTTSASATDMSYGKHAAQQQQQQQQQIPHWSQPGVTTVLDCELVTVHLQQQRHLLEIMDVPMWCSQRWRTQRNYKQRMDPVAQNVQAFHDMQRTRLQQLQLQQQQPPLHQLLSYAIDYHNAAVKSRKFGGGSAIALCLDNHWSQAAAESASECFDIAVKPLFLIQDAQLMEEHLVPRLPYPVDGVCTTPLSTALTPLQCPLIKKQKRHHTFDFYCLDASRISAEERQQLRQAPRLDRQQWLSRLMAAHFGGDTQQQNRPQQRQQQQQAVFGTFDELSADHAIAFSRQQMEIAADASTITNAGDAAYDPTLQTYLLLVSDVYADRLAVFATQSWPFHAAYHQAVVECRWDIHRPGLPFTPKIVRNRDHPNAHFTVERTMTNVVEQVDIRELYCCSSSSPSPSHKTITMLQQQQTLAAAVTEESSTTVENTTLFHPDYESPLAVVTAF
jgi:hypothetical protein